MQRSIRDAQPRSAPDGFIPGGTVTRFALEASYDAAAHTVEAVLSTGAPVQRWGMVESLAITPESIDLARVEQGQVRLLDSHDQSSIEAAIGVVERVWIEGAGQSAQLVGVVRFADTDRGRAAEARVASGDPPGVSIGYRVSQWMLTTVTDNIENWRADRWELLEVSLVAVPADSRAVIRSNAAITTRANAQQEDDDMRRNLVTAAGAVPAEPNQTITTPQSAAAAPGVSEATRSAPQAQPAGAASSENVLNAERARTRAIHDIGTRAGMDSDTIGSAIADGSDVESFRAMAFEHLAARSSSVRVTPSDVIVGRDETETRRRGMTDAIVHRLARASARGGDRNELPDHARAWGEMGLVEMAAECIGHRGVIRSPASVIDVFERAMMSTGDFPAIFQDAINRRLLQRYQAATPIYRRIAAQYNTADFRPTNVVRAGDFPSLMRVPETGEIKAGKFSESKETFRVYSHATRFNLSRQMIINDNLGAIDQVLGSAGDRIADWENAIVLAVVVENPDLTTDATAVFHAAKHGNLAASGSAITIASIGAGRAAMAKQTSLDGIKLNLQPSILLCSPDKQTEAEQLVTGITPALIASAVPDGLRRLVPVADANLTGNAWYLFADPQSAPVLIYGYLDGFEGPRLSTEQKFDVQGVGVKLEHDFGAGAIDYRGAYKNPGA